MPLDYELDSQLKELTEISGNYLEWFLQLTQRILFVDDNEDGQNFSRPVSFQSWLDEIQGTEIIDAKLLETLEIRYGRLVKLSDELINNNLKFKTAVSHKDFNQLAVFFEAFMDTLRRVEKEIVLDGAGIEPVTGLRQKSVLAKDLDREMQRLARQGKPFSLALVQIENYNEIKAAEGDEEVIGYLKHVAELIKKCMRSFDDAYRTNEYEFVLSLKQADVSGGIRALERLKDLLERNKYTFNSDTLTTDHVSLSCCVAEPLPDDNINDLIENMRKDLTKTEKEEATVLEYYELSPLQRYIQSN